MGFCCQAGELTLDNYSVLWMSKWTKDQASSQALPPYASLEVCNQIQVAAHDACSETHKKKTSRKAAPTVTANRCGSHSRLVYPLWLSLIASLHPPCR